MKFKNTQLIIFYNTIFNTYFYKDYNIYSADDLLQRFEA